jgi:hypothetical protein
MQLAELRVHHWVIGYLPDHRLLEYGEILRSQIRISLQSAHVPLKKQKVERITTALLLRKRRLLRDVYVMLLFLP